MRTSWSTLALAALAIGGCLAIVRLVPAEDPRGGQVVVVLVAGLAAIFGQVRSERRHDQLAAKVEAVKEDTTAIASESALLLVEDPDTYTWPPKGEPGKTGKT